MTYGFSFSSCFYKIFIIWMYKLICSLTKPIIELLDVLLLSSDETMNQKFSQCTFKAFPSRHGWVVSFLCFLFTTFITCCFYGFGGGVFFLSSLGCLSSGPTLLGQCMHFFLALVTYRLKQVIRYLSHLFLTLEAWKQWIWTLEVAENWPLRGPLTLCIYGLFCFLPTWVFPPHSLLSLGFVRGKKSPIYFF